MMMMVTLAQVALVKKGRAVFGRIDKYVSRGALISETCSSFELYEGGEIGFYSEVPVRVFVGDRELEVKADGNLKTVLADQNDKLLRIEK